MAAFGDRGLELIERFARKLDLGVPITAWHAARDRIVELLSTLALLTGSLAKIANEIIALNQNEISELSEPFTPGQVGSSTMPHKRNPELSERAVALAKLVRSHASLSYDSLIAEHERDYRTVRLEWITVTDAVLHTSSTLELMHIVLSGLVVNEDSIRQHTQSAADQLCTEPLMFCLGNCFGKQTAHQVVYEASMRARDHGTHIVDELLMDGRVAASFDRTALEAVVSPENYVGAAGAMVDRVVGRSRRRLTRNSMRGRYSPSECQLRDRGGCRACFPCERQGTH
jgi:adenylosuccinate lyase